MFIVVSCLSNSFRFLLLCNELSQLSTGQLKILWPTNGDPTMPPTISHMSNLMGISGLPPITLVELLQHKMQHHPWKHIPLEELFLEDYFAFVGVWLLFCRFPILPKPESRAFWAYSLLQPPCKAVTLAEAAIICPVLYQQAFVSVKLLADPFHFQPRAHLCDGRRKGPETMVPGDLAWREGGGKYWWQVG